MQNSKNKATNVAKKDSYNPTIPALDEFLKAGVHFGHKTSHWNPKMADYIYGDRNGIHIIDIIKTMKLLKSALIAVKEASDKGYILFVGTKGQAASVLEQVGEDVGAFYVTNRWPGGLFTNFNVLKRTIKKYMDNEMQLADALGEDMLKKEILSMDRDVKRLSKIYRGLRFMDKLPKMIVVVDTKTERVAIKEANKMKIPVVAILDTNCNPEGIDYPIPANDDSIKSISLLIKLIGDAVKSGRKSESLRALRTNYYAELDARRNEALKKKATVQAMKEEEMNRIKRLKEQANKLNLTNTAGKAVNKSEVKKTKTSSTEGESIDNLNISATLKKHLVDAGFDSVAKIKNASKSDLLAIKGVGPKAVESILESVK